MNEETLIAFSGIALVAVFTLPFIALPIIAYKVYRKYQTTKKKQRLEAQAASAQQDLAMVDNEPTSPRRTEIIFIGMALLVVIWGLMVGFGVGVFSHLIYIVFLIPLVMGINSGKMIVEFIQRAKIRTTAHMILLSILSAVVIYGTFHYTRYLGFQFKASMEIYSGLSEATEIENLQVTKAFLDYALKEETGHSGFLGYMLYEASQGTTIGRLFRSSSVNLGPALTWLYWLIEFGIILGVTIQKGKKMIGQSFCESCGNWHSGERHLGGTALANEALLLDAIKQKDFTELGKLLEKNAELPSLEVYLRGCETCNESNSDLMIRRAVQGSKGSLQFSDALHTTLQPSDSVLLLSQLSL